MPRRAHARSAKDTPGTMSMSTFAARNSSTVFSATFGLPGTAYTTSPLASAASDDIRRDRAVHRVEVVALVVELVERLERDADRGEIVDRRVASSARESNWRRVRTRRARPAGRGPHRPDRVPTTTTRARLTRRGVPERSPARSSSRARAVRAATATPGAATRHCWFSSSKSQVPNRGSTVTSAPSSVSFSSATSCAFTSPPACCSASAWSCARIWSRKLFERRGERRDEDQVVAELGLHRADHLAERRGVGRLLELGRRTCRPRGIRAAHPQRPSRCRWSWPRRGRRTTRRPGAGPAAAARSPASSTRMCATCFPDSHADNASLFASK